MCMRVYYTYCIYTVKKQNIHRNSLLVHRHELICIAVPSLNLILVSQSARPRSSLLHRTSSSFLVLPPFM